MARANIELTKEDLRKLPTLYSQENANDPICVVKFFDAHGSWEWYVIEYDPKEEIFFGYVIGHYPELGYFSMKELRNIKLPSGINRIERDIHFNPVPLSKIKERVNH